MDSKIEKGGVLGAGTPSAAYEEIKDGFSKNINTRKEFYSLKPLERREFNIPGILKSAKFKYLKSSIIPNSIIKKEIERGNFLQLHSYQIFVKNFMNPDTPYKRLLIEWETGTGKTIAAISIAMSFIDYYRRESERGLLQIGTVFVIGFTRQVFKRELFKYPELGFITRSERKRLEELFRKRSFRGTKTDITNYRDFSNKIVKRVSNRKNNGFFKFYGYKEFVGKIFILGDKNINITSMSEEEILNSLSTGKIKFNEELLESFSNSLIICDEIHNVYNSLDKNNWGVAIQSVLDNVPSARAVFLSATPINNSPTEVVDLMNLLLPSKTKLKKEDFFSNIKAGILKPGALDKIKKLSMGRISFIKDTNPLYFPSKVYLGKSIPGISYLKFTRCPMSQFQYKTYEAVYKGTITQDSQYIIDFALPNPKYGIPEYLTRKKKKERKGKRGEEPEIGMFQTKQIKSALRSASQEWKEKVGLDWENNMIIGDALEKDRLKRYSNKFYTMVLHVQNSVKKKMGKIFIYHNIVHISGVLFIQEVLKKNGIIMLNATPTGDTLCTHDGLTMNEHSRQKIKDHEFNPVRFIVAHSEIDRSKMNKDIQRFNDPDNSEGDDIMILVGSKIVKESYDIKAVQNVYIMGRPDNIPTLIQIIGRTVRKNSHKYLPPDQQVVRISIFTSCLPAKKKMEKCKMSYEEIKYKEKIGMFKIIQRIDKEFHEGSVDMPVNMYLMFTDQGKFKSTDPLGPIDFKPDYQIPKNFSLSDMLTTTFETFYEKREMNQIMEMIKRLFIEEDVAWTYNQLFNALKHPPIEWEINVNPHTFSEGNFQIALARLTWLTQEKYTEHIILPEIKETENISEKVIDTMMDPNDKIILLPNGQACVIVQAGIYYCLMPINTETLEPIIDMEMPYRTIPKLINRNVNIKLYLESLSPEKSFPAKKERFKQKYQNLDLPDMEDAICDFGADFHQIFLEEIIDYIFNLLIGRIRMSKRDFHEFYFKMLYYYDIIGIVIWASTAKDFVEEKYAKYVTEEIPVESIVKKEKQEKIKITRRTDILRILESSVSTAGCNWCPNPIQEQYCMSLATTLEMVKPGRKLKKVPANMLPIGHFMREIPRFYDVKTGWTDVPSYLNKVARNWKENNLIIGYDEKSRTGVHVRFKIRSPVHDIKRFKDTRKIEKGSVCSSKSKTFLLQIANELKIELPKKINVVNLCNGIRSALIFNEIRERNDPKSKLKFFYYYYETQPKLI